MDEATKSILRISQYIRGSSKDLVARRTDNVKAIESLPRDSLKFSGHERQLLLFESAGGERIYIQFPGKESSDRNAKGKARRLDVIKPWDFRPRYFGKGMTRPGKDLEFAEIWATAFENAANLKQAGAEATTRAATVMFYRMCYMLDHVEVQSRQVKSREVHFMPPGEPSYGAEKDCSFGRHWAYRPNPDVVGNISARAPLWGGMSFEAFLHYNEFLAWNEDCKYYYRKYFIQQKKGAWNDDTGRINTIRSHIRILGYILGDVPLASLLQGFVRGKGVCPILESELRRVISDFGPSSP